MEKEEFRCPLRTKRKKERNDQVMKAKRNADTYTSLCVCVCAGGPGEGERGGRRSGFKKASLFRADFCGYYRSVATPCSCLACPRTLQCSGKVPSDRWFDVVVGRFSPHPTLFKRSCLTVHLSYTTRTTPTQMEFTQLTTHPRIAHHIH